MAEYDEKISNLIKLGLQYEFSIAELSKKFGLTNRTISKVLKENGWSPNLSSSLVRMRKNGVNIEQLLLAAQYYLYNNVTFEVVVDKYGVTYDQISKYLNYIEKLPNKKDRKCRQKAWNTGLSKHTDSRVASYAKTKSGYISGYGYKKVWSDELKKSVNEHHYVWFKNTGYWPDTSKGEQIHHIDGNKLNNDYSNLILVDVASHSAIHKNYEQLTCLLIKEGYISFNKNTNQLETGYLWQILNESGK